MFRMARRQSLQDTIDAGTLLLKSEAEAEPFDTFKERFYAEAGEAGQPAFQFMLKNGLVKTKFVTGEDGKPLLVVHA